MMEALVCHPLDTIKVRMQLSRRATAPGVSWREFHWTVEAIANHVRWTRLSRAGSWPPVLKS